MVDLSPIHPYEDHHVPSARSVGTFTEPEDQSSHLMDQCSRHDIPPAVTGPHRPAGARSVFRVQGPVRISAHLPAAHLDQLRSVKKLGGRPPLVRPRSSADRRDRAHHRHFRLVRSRRLAHRHRVIQVTGWMLMLVLSGAPSPGRFAGPEVVSRKVRHRVLLILSGPSALVEARS